MNVQNVKQKLDKVNNFYAYLIKNQSIVSRVDKDAFLASIRALYDACFEEAVEEAPAVPTPTPPNTEPQPAEPAKKKPKLVFNTPTNTPKQEPQPTPTPTPVATTPSTPPVTEQPPVVATPPPPVEKPVEPTPTPQPPVPVPTPVNIAPPAAEEGHGFNDAYETLFHFQEATDLSQKLSTSKLDNLQKALGLNEKFLYINELFGGDVGQFQTAIKVLNDGETFVEARHYIEKNLIEQNNWMHKTKRPIAKDFIKLIRRRYA